MKVVKNLENYLDKYVNVINSKMNICKSIFFNKRLIFLKY